LVTKSDAGGGFWRSHAQKESFKKNGMVRRNRAITRNVKTKSTHQPKSRIHFRGPNGRSGRNQPKVEKRFQHAPNIPVLGLCVDVQGSSNPEEKKATLKRGKAKSIFSAPGTKKVFKPQKLSNSLLPRKSHFARTSKRKEKSKKDKAFLPMKGGGGFCWPRMGKG